MPRSSQFDYETLAEFRYHSRRFLHFSEDAARAQGLNSQQHQLLLALKGLPAGTKPTVGASCVLSGGRWLSYYDNATWTLASDLDIDHLVPLAEAWDSGARNWTAAQSEQYANDLGDARDLVAVTDNVNQAKGDRDPAEWMPSAASATCRYVAEWTAVKIRWRLTVDSAEKSALTGIAAGCTNVTITVTQAI